jgi:hypothetical protein
MRRDDPFSQVVAAKVILLFNNITRSIINEASLTMR